MLVYFQHTLRVRHGRRVLEQEVEAAPVELLLIPAGHREEPLQALGLLSLCPATGSVLARAVRVLLRSAGSSNP